MKKRTFGRSIKTWLSLLLPLLVLALAGCGGGSGSNNGDSGGNPAKATLSGTASEGTLIKNGTVRLKDALGKPAGTTSTDSNGRYSFDVIDMTAPFVVSVTANSKTYISYTSGAGTANINPVTTMVLSLATGTTNIQVLFESLTNNNVERMQSKYKEKVDEVTTALQALLPKGKGAGNYFTDGIVEGSGVDAVFDNYLFVVDAVQGFKISNKTTDKKIWSVPANDVALDNGLPKFFEDKVDNKPNEPVDTDISKPDEKPTNPGTSVSGAISVDTIWTRANSPYYINKSTVVVAPGTTLTIEPGVEVLDGVIRVCGGTLSAVGTLNQKITFKSVDMALLSDCSTIYNSYKSKGKAVIEYGYLDKSRVLSIDMYGENTDPINSDNMYFAPGIAIGSILTLKNSVIINNIPGTTGIILTEPSDHVHIENNTFIDTNVYDDKKIDFKMFAIHIQSKPSVFTQILWPVNISVINNLFVDYKGWPVNVIMDNLASLDFRYNSFINSSGISIQFLKSPPSEKYDLVDISQNYWGTTDLDVISKMIYDYSKEFNSEKTVNYLPILMEPHPDTPDVTPYL